MMRKAQTVTSPSVASLRRTALLGVGTCQRPGVRVGLQGARAMSTPTRRLWSTTVPTTVMTMMTPVCRRASSGVKWDGARRGQSSSSSSSSSSSAGGGGVSMGQVKELRARTGAGVMDCKEALSACGGDVPKATAWLLAKARTRFLKKADRPTTEGALALARASSSSSHSPAPTAALLLELNSETDFVGRLEGFQKLAHDAAAVALARAGEVVKSPSPSPGDTHLFSAEWLASLPLEQDAAGVASKTVDEAIVGLFMQVGENMKVRRAVLMRAASPQGVVGCFIQGTGLPDTGTVAALVALQIHAPSNEQAREQLALLANTLAQHIAGSNPKYLSLRDVPPEARGAEKESVILEQEVSFDQETGLVRDLLEREGKKLGGQVNITHFVRWKVGDGLEKRVADFAAEVEKELQRSGTH